MVALMGEQKTDLRTEAKQARAQAFAALPQAGQELAEVFCNSVRPAPRVVAGYMPIGQELDVRPLLLALAQQEATLCLPAIKDDTMRFFRWQKDDPLRAGAFDILEPTGGEELVPELVLMPLLAFTRTGARLGYGGGHYDKWFASHTPAPQAIGIAFAEQEQNFLPQEPHDVLLNAICTPSEYIEV